MEIIPVLPREVLFQTFDLDDYVELDVIGREVAKIHEVLEEPDG